MREAILSADALTVGYRRGRRRQLEVCSGLNFAFHSGEVCALIGPNGAGKSTLLRTLAGLQPALAGGVGLQGCPLERYSHSTLARKMAVVLTGRIDVGRMSCRALVSLSRYPYTGWLRRNSRDDEEAVESAMSAVGITDLAEAEADELSDGEFEKVMIARALAQEPEVMLLDEPAAYLDFARRVELMQLLNRLAKERGMAVLATSHDLDLVLRSADRVVLLANGGAAGDGAPEDLVLSRRLEHVFSSSLVYFDMEEGSFRARRRGRGGTVAVHGSGEPAAWTARALERAGFDPVAPGDCAEPAAAEVHITAYEGGPAWELQGGSGPRRYTSLYTLLRDLSNEEQTAYFGRI